MRASDASPLLAPGPDRPGVISRLFPAQLGLEGADPAQVGDDAVAAAYRATLASLPGAQAGMAAGLLPDEAEPETADRG